MDLSVVSDLDGATPLCSAVSDGFLSVSETLIDEGGADVNSDEADNEQPPLVWAAAAGEVDCVRLLLRRKANVHQTDADGKSALYYANLHGNEDCVAALSDTWSNGGAPMRLADDAEKRASAVA